MKNRITRLAGALLTFAMAACLSLGFGFDSEAAESTFSGTISDKTTTDTLFLVTSGGTMEIKIDSTADLSTAKFLLPGYKVTASCYTGSDEYWHASKIAGTSVAGSAAIDTSKPVAVVGTVDKGTNEEMLILKTKDGEMHIKIDPTTDVSGVRMFLLNRSLQVVCASGSDSYLHALAIADNAAAAGTVQGTQATFSANAAGTNTTPVIAAPPTTLPVATATQTNVAPAPSVSITPVSIPADAITGTVDKSTTASVLHLNTSGGIMQLKIDANADCSGCHTLLPGETVAVAYYRGSDEWLHTGKIVKTSSKQTAGTGLDGTTLIVAGTVGSKSDEGTLLLDTNGGTMNIKLDPSTDFSACPLLTKGKSIEVTCLRGQDEYYHAVSVKNK